jgi:hypothetical protein
MFPSSLYFVEQPCPWCGEMLELTIDPASVPAKYIEDCQVCCAPILVHVSERQDPLADPEVRLEAEGF